MFKSILYPENHTRSRNGFQFDQLNCNIIGIIRIKSNYTEFDQFNFTDDNTSIPEENSIL